MNYYRKNRYGESICVRCDECGSCGNYDFLREDDTNKCRVWGKYYSYTEKSCRRWDRSQDVYSSGCFLTTACCEYKGLADDAYELESMRSFRDDVLEKTVVGRELVKHYYEIAPLLVDEIERSVKKERILEWIYQKIQYIVKLLDNGEDASAISEYVLLVWETELKLMDDISIGDDEEDD